MTPAVLLLKNLAAKKAILTGTKGSNLAKMVLAGLPVPDGFVITTKVFQHVVAALPEIQHLQQLESPNQTALKRASAKVRTAILACALPASVEKEIGEAFDALGASAVSARSSSTAEDLAEASFAGQYDSFLNVRTAKDLIARIKDVWVSLYSPHALSYRRRHGIRFEKASMAVVVQTQLKPDASGVLFTKDPVSGKGQYVVTAVLGLGEGVVAGTAEADRFVLAPSTGKTITAEIASKTRRVVATTTGGVKTETVNDDLGEAPTLTPTLLKELAGYGRKLVRMGKGPQDIEFAVVKNKIALLQTRAITALAEEVPPEVPWAKGASKRYTWFRKYGPCTRLEEEYRKVHAEQMRICYEEVGSSMTESHLSHWANGYVFSRPNPHDAKTMKRLQARQTRRVNASLRKGKSYFEDVLQEMIEDRLQELKQQRAAAKTRSDLIAYMEACIKNAAWVQGNLHWRQGKAGGRPDWTQTFHEITAEPPLNAHIYTLAVQNRMTRLVQRIRGLARIAQNDRVLKKLMLRRQFDALYEKRVADLSAGKEFWQRFHSMLRVYGQRNGAGYGASNSFTTPTWNMDWSVPLSVIASYVEQDLDKIDQTEREARAERIRATAKMRRKLAQDPQKLKRFNEGVEQAIIGVRFLENHNYYMEQCSIGTMREAVYAVGKALVEDGLVEDPDDIVHLSLDELKAVAKSKKEQRPLVRQREHEFQLRKRMKPPQTIGKTPKPRDTRAGSDEKPRGLDGNTIRGASASAGCYRGRALVIERGKPHAKVHPGDILVAENVGPDWTPTFAIIGGLVLDSGSLGQHAALVAREYRIPAVMMTQEASKVIKNHQIITVDGDNGIVLLE
jgi:rifampicin phosphotransferase